MKSHFKIEVKLACMQTYSHKQKMNERNISKE